MFAGPPPDQYGNRPDAVPRFEPLSQYGNPPFYRVAGRTYHVLPSAEGYVKRGVASWYGPNFHGKRTSSGETYNMYEMTAAHPTLPLPSYVRVTNLENGKSAVLRVNDRGPFKKNRVIDLSYAAARKLGVWANGTASVEVRAIIPGQPENLDNTPLFAQSNVKPAKPDRFPADVFVQVGAFSEFANAYALQTRVRDMELGHTFISPTTGDGLYRVRIGPMSSAESADAAVSALHQRGLYGARLVVEHRSENIVRNRPREAVESEFRQTL